MKLKHLIPLFVLALLFQGCVEESEEASPPNIVFIMSDDHAYQAISAYGSQLIQTPNIDRLANEGIMFTNACVSNSICAPSRAVILTGKHSHINGKTDNANMFDMSQPTFNKLMQAAGYQTAMVGKWHLHPNAVSWNWAEGSLISITRRGSFSSSTRMATLHRESPSAPNPRQTPFTSTSTSSRAWGATRCWTSSSACSSNRISSSRLS